MRGLLVMDLYEVAKSARQNLKAQQDIITSFPSVKFPP